MAEPLQTGPMQNWVVRKPVAASRGGLVAAQNGVAARVGAEILAAGGSAVDAVVATAFGSRTASRGTAVSAASASWS